MAKTTRDIVIDMLKHPNVPALTPEGISATVDYLVSGKWRGGENGPSRKVTMPDAKQFSVETTSQDRDKIKKDIFIKIVKAMIEDMDKYPDYFDRMSSEKSLGFKNSFTDYKETIRLVEEGRIDEAIATKFGTFLWDNPANLWSSVGDGAHYDVPYITNTTTPTGIRIYINTSNGSNAEEFLRIYASKCIESRIPYTMKGMYHTDQTRTDGTILYIPLEHLEANIEILTEIQSQHPDIVESFGTPLYSGHNMGYFGVGIETMSRGDGNFTHNLFIDYMMYLAFTKAISQKILEMFDSRLTSEQRRELIELSKDEAGFSDKFKYGIARFNMGSFKEPRGVLWRFFDNEQYHYFMDEIMRVDRAGLEQLMSEKLALVSSIVHCGDKKHLGYPMCIPKELYEYYGVEPPKMMTTPKKGNHTRKTAERESEPANEEPAQVSVTKVNEIQPQKRVLSADRVMQLLKADVDHLRKTLISFGFPYATTEGLSEQVLRDMIFDRAIPEDSAIIDILCSKDSSFKKTVFAMGERMVDVVGKSRDEVERMFIERVGLDNVINASYEMQRQDEERGVKRSYIYENTLEAMRYERGYAVLSSEEYRSLPTAEARREYLSSLPPRVQEDVVRTASATKNFSGSAKEIADIIVKGM